MISRMNGAMIFKKRTWTLIIGAILLQIASAGGADAQDPGFSVDLTAEVQERDVIEKGTALGSAEVKGDASSSRVLLRMGLRPARGFEFYLLGGGADLSIDEFDGFSSKMNPAYGFGAYLTLFESPPPQSLHFFLDARYLRFVAEDRVETLPGPQDETIRWNEVSARFGAGGYYPFFHPYGGIGVSFVRAKDSLSGSGKLSLQEEDNIGFFAGADLFLDPSEAAAFNVEFSLGDVNAIRGGFRFKF